MTDVNAIFTKAYIRVSNTEKAVKGFAKSGIFPVDSGVFCDDDFYGNNQQEQIAEQLINDNQKVPGPSCSEPIPGCSKQLNVSDEIVADQDFHNDSFESVVPLPTKEANSSRRQQPLRQKQRSEILTSTHLKVVLQEKQRKRAAKELGKQGTKKQRYAKKARVRKVFDSSSEEESDGKNFCDDDELDDVDPQDIDFDRNEGEPCLVCKEYGKKEMWYRCVG